MRRILVVVDMQRDFIDGALGTREAAGVVGAVCEKIRTYGPGDIFATMDTHGGDYLGTQEGRMLPVPHCVKGTAGWELYPCVAELLGSAHIYEKPAFAGTELVRDLKAMSAGEDIGVEIVGLCTDICVVANALLIKAEMPETVITVDAACCAGTTPERHAAALDTMRSCQIIITNG